MSGPRSCVIGQYDLVHQQFGNNELQVFPTWNVRNVVVEHRVSDVSIEQTVRNPELCSMIGTITVLLKVIDDWSSVIVVTLHLSDGSTVGHLDSLAQQLVQGQELLWRKD